MTAEQLAYIINVLHNRLNTRRRHNEATKIHACKLLMGLEKLNLIKLCQCFEIIVSWLVHIPRVMDFACCLAL